MGGGREKITADEKRVLRWGLKGDQVVKVARLTGCKNFVRTLHSYLVYSGVQFCQQYRYRLPSRRRKTRRWHSDIVVDSQRHSNHAGNLKYVTNLYNYLFLIIQYISK